MKPITAIQMRHFTNEVLATESMSDYQKAESPMAISIKYLEIEKEIMEQALDGKHEARISFSDSHRYVVRDVAEQLEAQGYKVEIPIYCSHIEIKW